MSQLVREVAGVSLATQGQYIIKRKFWSFFERVLRVWTMDGQLIFRFFNKEFSLTTQPSRLDPQFVLAVALLALIAEAHCEDSN